MPRPTGEGSSVQDDDVIELRKRSKSPMRVLIGTWVRGWDIYGLSLAGDVDFGPDASFEHVKDLRLCLLDQTRKSMNIGGVDRLPGHILVLGVDSGRKNADDHLDHDGVWRYERNGPLPMTQWRPHDLPINGTLSLEPPWRQEPSRSYTFNPNYPMPTIGGVQNLIGGLPQAGSRCGALLPCSVADYSEVGEDRRGGIHTCLSPDPSRT